jgi:hypothetical protein
MTAALDAASESTDYSRVARVLVRIALRLVTQKDQGGEKKDADDCLLQGVDRGAGG